MQSMIGLVWDWRQVFRLVSALGREGEKGIGRGDGDGCSLFFMIHTSSTFLSCNYSLFVLFQYQSATCRGLGAGRACQ